jgi:hypothetical protein
MSIKPAELDVVFAIETPGLANQAVIRVGSFALVELPGAIAIYPPDHR